MRKLYLAFVLAMVMMFAVVTGAMAQEGCPDWSGKQESGIVGAYFTTDGKSANYYFGSLVNRNPVNGVPGLIKYCVYPDNGKPSEVKVFAVGADGDPWEYKLGDPEFSFGRKGGNPNNIPLDGSSSTPPGMLIGTATWTGDAPNNQTILLHINDPGECYKLYYPKNPGTCWVFPSSKWPPQEPDKAILNVIKFYDANANGINDDGQEITGWKIKINEVDAYTPYSELVDPGTYFVEEYFPNEPNWIPTTLTSVDITLETGQTGTVEFGNLCLGAGGGFTLGFWSNKNGQALFGDDDLAQMVSLNLRKADGSHFDPASYAAFRTWLLSANATNMAYMLSAQLAAMALNVFNGKVNGDALIYAPGTTSANPLGFATVNAIITEANAELGLHGTAYSGDAWRSYQEALKNALDRANNNKTFVQPTPCPFTFAE